MHVATHRDHAAITQIAPGGGGGVLPFESDGDATRKISRTPLKGIHGRFPNTNLTKITFEHFLSRTL